MRFNSLRFNIPTIAISALLFATVAKADLVPFKDYQVSQSVWDVTMVKVHPNMLDAYLQGIKKTWVASSKIEKQLGQIEDYKIYESALPGSGDFNLMLAVEFKNDAALAPNEARYDAFMKAWGAKRNAETTQIAQKEYPAMRKITGEYLLREITMK